MLNVDEPQNLLGIWKMIWASVFMVDLIIIIGIFLFLAPFIINPILAESRGKSVPLVLLLTLIFSWIVTLILAFTIKEKEVRIPKYVTPAVTICLIVVIISSLLPLYLLNKDNRQEIQAPAPVVSPQATFDPMIEIQDFTVNIISKGDQHYVKAAITIELVDNPAISTAPSGAHGGSKTGNDLAKEEVTQRMPLIRDSILVLIGNKTYEELQELEGKKQLKTEITAKLNSLLHDGKVKEIYFTDFNVQ
jgi:flagellar FliL protein